MSYLPPEVQSALLLQPEEFTIQGFPNINSGSAKGALVLTNRRIIFLTLKGGYYREGFSIALEAIYELSMKKGLVGGPKLMVAGRPLQGQNLDGLQQAVAAQRQRRLSEVDQGTGGRDARYTMGSYVFGDANPSGQHVVKEKVVTQIIKVRCQYCSKLYDENKSGCPFCGAGR